jgi:hypothetical protein
LPVGLALTVKHFMAEHAPTNVPEGIR